ncbi:MAG: hypothetical protein AAF298_24310 [Cyanobacteria bacterium P01_A01_bin.40]
MLIQDLPYINDANYNREIKGGKSNKPWRKTSGNVGAATANSYSLGKNTFSETGVKVDVVQGVGSSALSYAIGLSVSDLN